MLVETWHALQKALVWKSMHTMHSVLLMLLRLQVFMLVRVRMSCSRLVDVLSLHIPATPQTVKSIDYRLVNLLPKKGVLVNTARKEVINEEELLKLMAEREDLKFVTDIKPDADEEFKKFEGRYFSTPKKMGCSDC